MLDIERDAWDAKAQWEGAKAAAFALGVDAALALRSPRPGDGKRKGEAALPGGPAAISRAFARGYRIQAEIIQRARRATARAIARGEEVGRYRVGFTGTSARLFPDSPGMLA